MGLAHTQPIKIFRLVFTHYFLKWQCNLIVELGAECGKQHSIKMPTFKNKAVARLVRLKFCLVNLLNSLQHFVFGSVFTKISLEFEADLSKAQDLNSLIEIHGKFVKSVTDIVSVLQMKMSGRDGSNNVRWTCNFELFFFNGWFCRFWIV